MHIKEITLGGIFAIFFVSTGLPSAFSEYGREIQTANYKMLDQHPQLKKCTETYLFQNGYVGCRVSIKTGKCQGLLPSWESQGTEEGYAYALKVSVQTTFQPPLKITIYEQRWEIPVTVKAGVQIDTFLSIPTWPDDVRKWVLGVTLFNLKVDEKTLSQRGGWVEMRVSKTKIGLTEGDQDIGLGRIESSGDLLMSTKIYKISLQLEANSVVMLVEDKKVGTLKLKYDFSKWRYISIYRYQLSDYLSYIHKLRFTTSSAEI